MIPHFGSTCRWWGQADARRDTSAKAGDSEISLASSGDINTSIGVGRSDLGRILEIVKYINYPGGAQGLRLGVLMLLYEAGEYDIAS